MLNYDFFKMQNIIKDVIINNKKISDYFSIIIDNNILLKNFLNINYDNKIIIDQYQEIKFIIDNIDNNINKNYIIEHNDIKYIFILTTNNFDLIDYFNNSYNDNDKIILFKKGLFSPILDTIIKNNGKIDYTFLPYGYFNFNEINLYNLNFKLFKYCINIGYNTNSDIKFPGISIGLPIFNNHYNIYNNYENDNILEEYEIIYNNFINLLKKVKQNYNILNIFRYNEYIKIYDNKNYVSIQDFLYYISNLYKVDINKIKILYQNNNYLLINKNEKIYQKYLLYYKTEFYKSFLKILEKVNQNKYKKINFLNNYYNINKEEIIIQNKDISKNEKKIGNTKIKLNTYLEILDKSIDDKINFI